MRFTGLVAAADSSGDSPSRPTRMFTLDELASRLGGRGELQRVMDLHATLQKLVPGGVSALVYGDPSGRPVQVVVRLDLTGECSCRRLGPAGICDHMAAAALEWLLAGGR